MRRALLTLALLGVSIGAPFLISQEWAGLITLASLAAVALYWVTSDFARRLHPEWSIRLERKGAMTTSAPSAEPTGIATAPVPDVRVRVRGNTASESWRRWLHLCAENMSPTIAKAARLRIRIRRDVVDDRERPVGLEREWMWTGAREEVDLRQGAPLEIPIAIADIASPPASGLLAPVLYQHEHLPIGKWYVTPEGHHNLGRHDELVPGRRYILDVTISWTTDGATTHPGVIDWFFLDLPERGSRTEAELIHTVSRERY